MKIVLIGAGNLATQLAFALQEQGYDLRQVFSRTEQSAALLANQLHLPYTTSLEEVEADADLYIASLKDDALMSRAAEIVRGKNRDALFIHTAGSVPMSVWEGHATHYGVIYPMQTFSKQRRVSFREIPMFVEANGETERQQLLELARSLSTKVYEASTEQRRQLHLTAVFVCNFVNHMYAIGEHLLSAHDLPFESMYPLMKETLEKVLSGMNPSAAQTGPAVRYDEGVMSKHEALLADHPEWQQLYQMISKSIHHDKLRSEQN